MNHRHKHKYRRFLEIAILTLLIVYFMLLVVSVRAVDRKEQYKPSDFASDFGNFMDIEGDKIYYERFPAVNESIKDLVFIHGFGASMSTWRYQVEYFRQNYNILLIDMAGFGLSQELVSDDLSSAMQARTVRELTRKLGIPDYFCIGHSFGGGVCQRLSLIQPEAVSGLALLGSTDLTAYPNISSLKWLNHPMLLQIPFGILLNEGNISTVLRTAYGPGYSITPEEYALKYIPFEIEGSTKNFIKHIFSFHVDELVKTGLVTQPTLIVYGDKDTWIGEATRNNLLTGIPNQLSFTISDAGHMVHEEKPTTINPLIDQFIRDNT